MWKKNWHKNKYINFVKDIINPKFLIDLITPNPVGDLFNKAFDQNTFKEKIEVTYSVNVIYDGESYSWEVITD